MIKSIKLQMTLFVILAALVVFTSIGLVIHYRLEGLPNYIQNQFLDIADARSDEIGKELEGVLNLVRMVSQSPVIQSMDLDQIKPYLPSLVIEGKIRNMTISDPLGNAWATYDMHIDISEQEQYQAIFVEGRDYIISEPFDSPFIIEPIPIITVSHVVQRDGDRVGLVNAVVSAAFIDQVVTGIQFKDTGYAYIVDEAGQVISHPNPDIGIHNNLSEWIYESTAIAAIASEKSGIIEYSCHAGHHYVAIFSEVENMPGWKMILTLDREEAYEEYLSIMKFMQVTFLIGLLAVWIFAYFYAGTISKPILALKDVFVAASEGNFNVKADTRIPNELGMTGEAFNQMLKQIKDLTYKDPITGLYNHNSFMIELYHKLKLPENQEGFNYLVIISLDDFKRINSIGGYESGNLALSVLAQKLVKFVVKNELVARYYGDEMIVFLNSPSKSDVTNRILELRNVCYEALRIKGVEHRFKASIGISFIQENADDLANVVHEATIAKLKVKRMGGDGFEFYNAHINEAIMEEQQIEDALFHAVENDELFLLYQPIVSIKTKKVLGHEALLRWSHPIFKTVPTPKIIELAEKKGLITEIGNWVLREACQQNMAWMKQGHGPLFISVNVSPLQLEDLRFVEMVGAILGETGMSGEYLDLEITETSAMTQVDDKIHLLKALKSMGVRISIDDFGTGYSSLSYFARFPVDTLKIDRMFVMNMLTDKNAYTITKTIIQMAKALNLVITAEGVETTAHQEALIELECDQFQGYLVSKPVQADVCEAMMKKEPFDEVR